MKILAAKAGLESISTQHGEITLNLFEGMRFERHKLARLERDGVKVGTFQIRLSPGRLGESWREVLEEVVRGVGD
jgi:hypothetical protein